MSCHGLDRVAPVEWDAILSRMVFLGAPVSGEDAKVVRSYLLSKFTAQ